LGKIALPDAIEQTQTLFADLSSNTPYVAAIGLASNKFAAHIAAVTANPCQTQFVRPGSEADFLAPFLLSRLAVGPTLIYQFRILGLHTLGQFAALPKAAVNEHFGTVGRQLYERAHGIDLRPVAAYSPRLLECWTRAFEPGLEDRQILENTLRTAGENLSEKLKRKNLAAGHITLLIHLDNRHVLESKSAPRESAMSIFALSTELMRLFKAATIAGPVTGLEIVLSDLREPTPYQLDFFGQLFADQSSIDTVANRLQPRYRTSGFYNVKSQAYPSYIPEQCFMLKRVGSA
jgi:nucleotidyltransferase/DNA polymerase involved in DNA repair